MQVVLEKEEGGREERWDPQEEEDDNNRSHWHSFKDSWVCMDTTYFFLSCLNQSFSLMLEGGKD